MLQNFYANIYEKNKTMHTFKKIKIRFISRLPYLKKIKLINFYYIIVTIMLYT